MVGASAAIDIGQSVNMPKSLTLNAEDLLQKEATGEILFTKHVLNEKIWYYFSRCNLNGLTDYAEILLMIPR